jgi:Ca-activated chloride channel family protein
VSVLEVVGLGEGSEQQFVPLRRTELKGEAVGPLASLTLTHTYGYTREQCDQVLEALYRFPLPGDAAVTAVRVRFGDVEIETELKPRDEAEADYEDALAEGKQAALLTRESPDVFTLRVAGIRPDEDVVVQTDYVQVARAQADQAGWQLRVPLTTAPRYVREDELGARHASGQPLALLRDPGHRFALDLCLQDAEEVASPTHDLDVRTDGNGDARRVRLRDGEVVPDRDLVLSWGPQQASAVPTLSVHLHQDDEHTYFLGLVAPPSAPHPSAGAAREVILLVDHSGSMEGAKWEAADWAVKRFLDTLTERDTFALGLFHNATKWFRSQPLPATADNLDAAAQYLEENRDSGGTNLGVALEQALGMKRVRPGDELSRHVLVVTDAQVTDTGRLLRLADREAKHQNRRRISLLCIDAAPNSILANQLAESGGGVAHFLTSSPEEEDITTAMQRVLADWAEPVLVDLRLEIDRAGAEAAGRRAAPADGKTVVDLGDLPRGRALWVAGRVPAAADDRLAFRLRTGTDTVATQQIDPSKADGEMPGLKALFGARKLLSLEHLIHARYPPKQLRARLTRLGYDADAILDQSEIIYAENALQAAHEALTPLLIEESLRYGIACSETGFVAVREEAGERVEATAVVGSALPAGWSPDFLSRPAAPGATASRTLMSRSSSIAPGDAYMAAAVPAGRVSGPTPSGGRTQRSITVFSGIPQFAKGEAVLFDSRGEERIPERATLTRLSVSFDGPPSVPPGEGMELVIYVGDLALPRASVRLEDLIRAGGERPLNLRRRAGEIIRIVLKDPDGAWASAAPQLTVSLRT